MTRAGKALGVIAALMVVVIAGWLLVIGAVVALGGVMTVQLVDRSEGLELYLPVPLALVDLALASTPSPMVYTAGFPAVQMDGVSVDLGEIGPVVLGLFEELDELPNATLVRVVDGSGSVEISKAGGKLVIEVEEPDASVAIAVPTRGAARLAGRIFE